MDVWMHAGPLIPIAVAAVDLFSWNRAARRTVSSPTVRDPSSVDTLPASTLRVIHRNGRYDHVTFASALIELLRAGVVRMELIDGRPHLVRGATPAWAVGRAELALVKALFDAEERVSLKYDTKALRRAMARHRASIEADAGIVRIGRGARLFGCAASVVAAGWFVSRSVGLGGGDVRAQVVMIAVAMLFVAYGSSRIGLLVHWPRLSGARGRAWHALALVGGVSAGWAICAMSLPAGDVSSWRLVGPVVLTVLVHGAAGSLRGLAGEARAHVGAVNVLRARLGERADANDPLAGRELALAHALDVTRGFADRFGRILRRSNSLSYGALRRVSSSFEDHAPRWALDLVGVLQRAAGAVPVYTFALHSRIIAWAFREAWENPKVDRWFALKTFAVCIALPVWIAAGALGVVGLLREFEPFGPILSVGVGGAFVLGWVLYGLLWSARVLPSLRESWPPRFLLQRWLDVAIVTPASICGLALLGGALLR